MLNLVFRLTRTSMLGRQTKVFKVHRKFNGEIVEASRNLFDDRIKSNLVCHLNHNYIKIILINKYNKTENSFLH